MYGIALEAMAQASWTFPRPEMPGYLRRAADWVFANPREWDPKRRIFLNAPVHAVMLTPGLAYIGETSGERKYREVALESFRRQTEEAQVTDRLKLFAQLFRNSQRFLWYLSVETPTAASHLRLRAERSDLSSRAKRLVIPSEAPCHPERSALSSRAKRGICFVPELAGQPIREQQQIPRFARDDGLWSGAAASPTCPLTSSIFPL